ncbi:hypothetical protein D9M68_968830 [compost metagenome]
MPLSSFSGHSEIKRKFAKVGDYTLANHFLAKRDISSPNIMASAPIDFATASAWLVIEP